MDVTLIKPSTGARLALVLAGGLTAASCASSPKTATAQFERCRAYSSPLYIGSPSFDEWKDRLRAVARKCGIGYRTVSRALDDVGSAKADDDGRLIAQVNAMPRRRPLPGTNTPRQITAVQLASTGDPTGDYTRGRKSSNAVKSYLDRRITPEFVEKGRELLDKHRRLLEKIEKKYGVPKEYLVAYWGIETNYGSFTGNHQVVPTLAKLGWGSKRRRFFSQELLAALIILDKGYARRSDLYGSFAGAMGQPQFMPSSYLYYAVDHDRDGRRDIWRTPGDIFASVANYNVRRGQWTKDYNYALTEVKLPDDFPFEQAGFNKPRPIADWIKIGVTRMDGRPLGDEIKSEAVIYMPAGCDGPAFLLNGNFHAIMRYNNLIEYGFAVAVLAERIRGDFAVRKAWPESDVALDKGERRDLQRLLTRLGHGDLTQDGVLGANTRQAVRSFQRKHRMCVDGHANTRLFRKVKSRFNRLYSMRSVTARELAEAAPKQ